MANASEETTTRLEFFEPPMCCSTGLCGPSVDEKLVQLNTDIETLREKYPGMIIERYMITQQPLKFRENPVVYQLVKEKGKEVLPITALNGEVIKTNQYPDLAETEKRIAGV
ncbi:arsenite efflux transporter metallochaperone ArsD [Anaeroselena agilis]|uniref:Arsenite efflux transporter metallochaperone ArsD n=1 Tax=Anaeroselena agilis TaxID=3063788 RepID=A0ABU3NV37_9FIRM|nr:arsenite efflux transporter metallochaperone ArsD [Selenomonadales bacterium 4137-cl]